ncbi:heme oxygenase-like protein [Phlegmacium glaucopus]|nr:heme oxygenase-like protein [Phlegmacium glaucopus]
MASVDYSKPLATLLRESTLEIHDTVATSVGAKLLLSGSLSREEYARYLMMLWHIYHALEKALDRHASHSALEPTYNPTLLARASSLAADISHLLEVDESSWKSHPIHMNLMAAYPPPLSEYVQRIEELSNSNDPCALLAHSYVRYLGDLSGGQPIRHTLAKAYNLDEATGFGISFYNFKELRSSKAASQGEMKRIKDWFREGMNVAGERNVQVKAAVLRESSRAFLLNCNLLTMVGLEKQEDNKEADKSEKETLSANASYPLSQILAVVGAACLAHFILVVGGFTGDGGYQKLLAIQQWLANTWQQSKDLD